ncbi:bacterial luciferase-like protein [Hyaloscypha bicolor E]|uniref:Bacterial luciferase-like protein n=1 Tax=Hyaloscypha bicolor E TaxID=1095630 RepID=A0A2J6SFU4_9HELO|nr:bacterial luciferase-like protein [Hyaloscypha bicolor E]PMD49645.1 bacterial luciferase-like protein [Hyaloscypha bicolor E]
MPRRKVLKYNNIKHRQVLAQKLEAAKFQAIFFADVPGGYDVYKGPTSLEPAIPATAQFPVNDPLYIIPAIAGVTESIGFGVTVSTSYEHPSAMACKFSAVNQSSNGRRRGIAASVHKVEHDKRYNIAHEYLEITYEFWEEPWRGDAVGATPKGSSADPKGLRQINHNARTREATSYER